MAGIVSAAAENDWARRTDGRRNCTPAPVAVAAEDCWEQRTDGQRNCTTASVPVAVENERMAKHGEHMDIETVQQKLSWQRQRVDEHREHTNDVTIQQHQSQKCNRMQFRSGLDEQEHAAVREPERFRSAQRRENADLDTAALSRRQMRSFISALRANMYKDQRH